MRTQGLKGILLMGGKGDRFRSDVPKQFHRLAGKKIYLYALERMLSFPEFEEIILVCHPEWVPVVMEETRHLLPVRVVCGGSTRQESSYLGILACGPETNYVVIHDAVRPFVSENILRANIDAAIQIGAVDTCIPSADTLVFSKTGTLVNAIPNRSHYLRGQTPQSFSYEIILDAHKKALENKIFHASDDCQLVLALNHPIHVVLGEENNIKITSELDLFIAEHLFRLHISSIPSMSGSLIGKKYAVTGGTGGIGQAICTLLRQEGAEAFPIARGASPFAGDLTKEAIVKKIFSQVGKLDGLINSLGTLTIKSLEHLSSKEIRQSIDTNLTALIYCCKWANLKKGAHILNIASSSYTRGRKDYVVYSATKAAVVNFTQGLAEERPDLKVNVLIPQRTDTLLRRDNFPDEDSRALLSPEVVAEEAVKLLKQEITGSIAEVKERIKT